MYTISGLEISREITITAVKHAFNCADNIEFMDLYYEVDGAISAANRDVITYHLHQKDYNDKDNFDILLHHSLLNVINKIIKINRAGTKVVLLLCTNTRWVYKGSMETALKRVVKIITQMLPVHNITTDLGCSEFLYALTIDHDAKVLAQVDKVRRKIERNAFKHFNLNKLIKYLDKRGMKYLSATYFQHLNSKLLAVNK